MPLEMERHHHHGYVPEDSCGLASTTIELLPDGPLRLVYGPDGYLVTRSACTGARCARSCEPAASLQLDAPASCDLEP